ncbi:MAG: hypothetical protein JW745_04530 [Sedimentisphaerales bacterium]|nr:hypothetical protein [Sedimentisphaerales bacterium]MBN2843973.1 hypothetical protein [Sedimentisphaerales bacterium]
MHKESSSPNKRRDKRVRFFWPVWVGHEREVNDVMYRGKAVDLTKQVVAITVPGTTPVCVGEALLTRFSFPKGDTNMFDMGDYKGWSEVVRVESDLHGNKRVALKLKSPIKEEYYCQPA